MIIATVAITVININAITNYNINTINNNINICIITIITTIFLF